MCKVIAVSNRKGGVGKTTTVVQLADLASNPEYGYGLKVLGIDFDHQGSFTTSLKQDSNAPGIYELIVNQLDPRIKINEHLDFITCSNANRVGNELSSEPFSEVCFAEALSNFKDEYDLILIDCPPEEDFMNNSAYAASDSIIIPMGSDRFSIEGIAELAKKLKTIRKLNPQLRIDGLLLTRIDQRTNAFKESYQDAQECAGILDTKVFTTCISRSTIVDEAQKSYKSILQYAPKSKVANEYMQLAKEIFN